MSSGIYIFVYGGCIISVMLVCAIAVALYSVGRARERRAKTLQAASRDTAARE